MVNYVIPDDVKKSRLIRSVKMRCYNEYFLERYSWYKGCMICEEWLNDRKLFCEWIDENYYLIDGLAERNIQLDKDILVPGNIVYAPTTCLFVPARMNTLVNSLTVTKNKNRDNGLPVGVHKLKDGKYFMAIGSDGKQHSKKVDTVEEAFDLYKEAKKKEFQKIADLYEDVVPEKVTEAFLKWMDIVDGLTVDPPPQVLTKKKEVENSYIICQKRGKKTYERLTCPTP